MIVPIVYRLGRLPFTQESGVRFSVGTQKESPSNHNSIFHWRKPLRVQFPLIVGNEAQKKTILDFNLNRNG